MAKNDLKILMRVTERLPVILTETELLDRGQRLAQLDSDLQTHFAREDALKKELKAVETKIDAERSRLSNIIRQKAELRDVECSVFAHFAENVVRTVRTDTGEVIAGSERPMSADERQELLDLDTSKPRPIKSDAAHP